MRMRGHEAPVGRRGVARRVRAGLAAVVLAGSLAACDTAEERAEQHYQNALALIAEGDVPRALVELRNVFDLDGMHREARKLYAGTVLAEGDLREAFGQYLLLAEQYPDDLDARRALARMSVESGSWTAAEEHVAELVERAPDDPLGRALTLALDYRETVRAGDDPARRALAGQARGLLETLPESLTLHMLVADSHMLDSELGTALEVLEAALAIHPEAPRLWRMRLTALARLDDPAGVEATLKEMIARFPEDESLAPTLIRFYGRRGDLDGAEAFLRGRIAEGAADDDARVALVRFLAGARGPETALAEAERRVAEGTNDLLFRAMAATLRFETGARDRAIAEMQDLLVDAPDDAQSRRAKISLARMLRATGNPVGARALVEEVVASDPAMVEARRMQARWLIDEDRTDEAITALRRALNSTPDDVAALTLMAEAHMRNGDRDLAGEVMALAVEASNAAPGPSRAYARFLIAENRLGPAETVLQDALRQRPDDVALLAALGQVFVLREDWGRAAEVQTRLAGLPGERARLAATDLQVNALRAQNRGADALALLREAAAAGAGFGPADLAIVRAHLEDGDLAAARAHVGGLLAEAPGDPGLRFVAGTLDAAAGDLAAAEAAYRGLLEEGVDRPAIWMQLVRLEMSSGRRAEARETLAAALAAHPDAPDLLWAHATLLERDGDRAGAIEVYERLYAADSGNVVVANNLASLISTTRSDAESLDRAYRIARRLRGSELPAFQDTYGWIAHLRGDHETALEHLEPAAAALTADPLVQLHLARVYDALGRRTEAVAQYETALAVAGDDPRPAFDAARDRLAMLRNPPQSGDGSDTDRAADSSVE